MAIKTDNNLDRLVKFIRDNLGLTAKEKPVETVNHGYVDDLTGRKKDNDDELTEGETLRSKHDEKVASGIIFRDEWGNSIEKNKKPDDDFYWV